MNTGKLCFAEVRDRMEEFFCKLFCKHLQACERKTALRIETSLFFAVVVVIHDCSFFLENIPFTQAGGGMF